MNYYNNKKQAIKIVKELGAGGEGSVHLMSDNRVLKIYKQDKVDSLKRNKIELLINKKLKYDGICFPEEIACDESGQFSGYVMQKAEGLELQHCVFNPMLIKEEFPKWTRVELTKLAISILDKMEYLHKNNIIMGDINPLNILVKNEQTIYFVDTDSYQVDNIPCPVGTVYYTAPEIQGKEYKDFLRTKEHEYFAIATLLFMIFLPGKPPYSFQGGGSPSENIRKGNFSYPLGDDDNFLTPQGMWEFLWLGLSFDLKKAFYEIFKEGTRISISDWLSILDNYNVDLIQGLSSKEILPSISKTLLNGKTLNMNIKDITEKDKKLRVSKTILNSRNKSSNNFAVIELSTKAVKLLMGDHNAIKQKGFSFDCFVRNATKTETGNGLDENNYMNMNYFDKYVVTEIHKMLSIAKNNGIDVVYGVATAAYRTANNREEIINYVKNKCGLNIRILTKKEEAISTLTAFRFCKPHFINYQPEDYILMIDQGGGSTEISLFNGKMELLDTYSINLGSTVLKTILFKEATATMSLDKAFLDSEKLVQLRLKTLFNSPKSKFIYNVKNISCVSVGTAITTATGKRGNPKQHGTILSYEHILNKINDVDIMLKNKYNNLKTFKYDLYNKHNPYEKRISDDLDSLVVMRVGLPMYKIIMENLNIKEIVVSGTGLWYGVFFEQLFSI